MRQALSLPGVVCLFLPRLLLAQISFDPQGQQLTPPSSNTPPEQRCVVEGHVTSAQTGEPLKKVHLRLVRGATALPARAAMHIPNAQGYSASSQPDGSFHFESVEPGTYALSAERPGYLESNYGATGPSSPGKTLTLAPAQQLTGVNLALTREAVMSGKVLDEDGDPAPDVSVQVLAARWTGGKLKYMPSGGTMSNDLGEFRIGHLGPGKYYLVAEQQGWMRGEAQAPVAPGKPDVRTVRTFYPDAVSRATATPIEIRAGQDAPGTDIRLHSAATYHVRGKIAATPPEGEAEHLNISLTPRDDETTAFFFGANSSVQKDLTFDIAGVAPGAYTLSVFKTGGPIRSLGRQSVDVGAADVSDVVINIVPPFTLHGQIRLEGTPSAGSSNVNLSNVRVSLAAVDRGMVFSAIENAPKPDGSFMLENISPGKYYVRVSRTPAGTYLKAIRFGEEDVYKKELDLSQGSPGELEIVFRYGPGDIDGTVTRPSDAEGGADPQNKTQYPAAASITLVPDVLPPDGTGIRQSTCDETGAFSMKEVSPGHYRVYAFEQVESEQLQNPDVLNQLQGRGIDFELKENEKKQLQLPLISAQEFQQILARLGIEPQ